MSIPSSQLHASIPSFEKLKEKISVSMDTQLEIERLREERKQSAINYNSKFFDIPTPEDHINRLAHQLRAIALLTKTTKKYGREVDHEYRSEDGHYYDSKGSLLSDLERDILFHPDLRIVINHQTEVARYDLSAHTLHVNPYNLEYSFSVKDFTNTLQSMLSRMSGNRQPVLLKSDVSDVCSTQAFDNIDSFNTRLQNYLKAELAENPIFDCEPSKIGTYGRFISLQEALENENPLEISLSHAVAAGGKKRAVEVLHHLGLVNLGTEAISEEALQQKKSVETELFLFATSQGNMPLMQALLEVGGDPHADPAIIQNIIKRFDAQMFIAVVRNPALNKSSFEALLLNNKGQFQHSEFILYNENIVKALLSAGFNDALTRSAMPYDTFFQCWTLGDCTEFQGPHWRHTHHLVQKLQALGVNFNIPDVLQWSLQDNSGKTPYLFLSHQFNQFKPSETAVNFLGKHNNDLVWLALRANHWKLMQHLRSFNASFNIPGIIRYGLEQHCEEDSFEHDHEKALTVILNSGQIEGFPTVEDPRSERFPDDGLFSSSHSDTWYPENALENWNAKLLFPYLSESLESWIERKAWWMQPGSRLSLEYWVASARFDDYLYHHATCLNEAFFRDISKAIINGDGKKLSLYISNPNIAKLMRKHSMINYPLISWYHTWQKEPVRLAIEQDNDQLLLSLKAAGFDISIQGAFGYAIDNKCYKVLKVLYDEYQSSGLIEGIFVVDDSLKGLSKIQASYFFSGKAQVGAWSNWVDVAGRQPETYAKAVKAELSSQKIQNILLNNPPFLIKNQITVEAEECTFVTNGNLRASDDFTPAGELVFTATEISGGKFEELMLSFPFFKEVSEFSQQKIADRKITFCTPGARDFLPSFNAAVNVPPSFNIAVSDGNLSTEPTPAIINFIPSKGYPYKFNLSSVLMSGAIGATLTVAAAGAVGAAHCLRRFCRR